MMMKDPPFSSTNAINYHVFRASADETKKITTPAIAHFHPNDESDRIADYGIAPSLAEMKIVILSLPEVEANSIKCVLPNCKPQPVGKVTIRPRKSGGYHLHWGCCGSNEEQPSFHSSLHTSPMALLNH